MHGMVWYMFNVPVQPIVVQFYNPDRSPFLVAPNVIGLPNK